VEILLTIFPKIPKKNNFLDLQDILSGITGSNNATFSALKTDLTNQLEFDFFGNREPNIELEKPGQIAINENGIEVQLYVDQQFVSDEASLRFIISNNNPVEVENVNLQAAVTKTCEIDLLTPTSQHLDGNGRSTITQIAKLRRLPNSGAPRLKLRINYMIDGQKNSSTKEMNVPELS